MSLFIDFMRPQSAVAQDFNTFAVLSITNDIGAVVKVYCETLQQAQAMTEAFNNPGRVTALEGFVTDFAAHNFEAIRAAGMFHPEDEPDDVTELEPIEAWQEDARALINPKPAKLEAAE